jgi:hypothetical protein
VEDRLATVLETLMAKIQYHTNEAELQVLASRMGEPVTLCYGRHLVGGAPAFQDQQTDGSTVLLILDGEGEWDANEYLWVNGKPLDVTDTTKVHFHPGLDGEAGVESDPAVRNQKICSFFPSGFTQTTFSRTAYTALHLPADPAAPSAEFDVRGIYRTRRVRLFDAAGNQTDYKYSANLAWQFLDAYISFYLKPRALVNAALTTGEKARIDFPAFAQAAADCDVDIGGGVKRFEGHVAFMQKTTLATIFETLMSLCRGYCMEEGGKLGLYVDKPRAAVFTITADMIRDASFEIPAKDLRQVCNQVTLKIRDIESGGTDHSKDFAPFTAIHNEQAHQDMVGRVIGKEMDLGANTKERSERLALYWMRRSLLPEQARLLVTMDAGHLLPGDVVAAPVDHGLGDEITLSQAMLSQSGITGWNPANVVNNVFDDQAWHTDSSTPGAWVKVDLGAGNGKAVRRAKIWASSAGYAGNYTIQYSDNDAAWTDAATDFIPALAGENEKLIPGGAAHRYWRLLLTNAPGPGPWLSELELFVSGEWEVMEVTDEPLADQDGRIPGTAFLRELILQEYDPTIFSDSAETQQETEETNIPTGNPPPASNANLIANGDMEAWSHFIIAGGQTVGLPDLWSYIVGGSTQDGYATRQPGLEGVYALGLNVGDAHGPPSTQYMRALDYPAGIWPGGGYYFSILARANPAISAGFRLRLVFRDASFAGNAYVELLNRVALGTTVQKIESRLIMPKQGDTTMWTGKWGTLAIVGTLNYDPAYVFVEPANYQPNVSSTVILDSAILRSTGDNAPAPVDAPNAPSWVEFSGDKGIFHFAVAPGSGPLTNLEHEIQIASDSGFTTNLLTLVLGSALTKDLRMPRVTRYARARSRYASSGFSAYVAYGSPTVVASGHPLDDASPGSFDPADPRLGSGVRQHDGSGNPRHLFRYDDPTHSLDLVADGATRFAAVEAGANKTETRTAAGIAAQGALATKDAVSLDTEVTDGSSYVKTTPTQRDGGGNAYLGLGSTGCVKPGKFADSNPGVVTGAVQIADGTTDDETQAWINVATVDFQVPADCVSMQFTLTPTLGGGSGTVRFKTTGDNIGIAIYTGSAPSSPVVTRLDAGVVTYPTPSGTKLSVYIRGQSGGLREYIEGKCSQDVVTPLRSGYVL